MRRLRLLFRIASAKFAFLAGLGLAPAVGSIQAGPIADLHISTHLSNPDRPNADVGIP